MVNVISPASTYVNVTSTDCLEANGSEIHHPLDVGPGSVLVSYW